MRFLVLALLVSVAWGRQVASPAPAPAPPAVPQATKSFGGLGCGFLWIFSCDKPEPKPYPHPEPEPHPKPHPEPEPHPKPHPEPEPCGGGCGPLTTTVELVCECRSGCSPKVEYALTADGAFCYCSNDAALKDDDCVATYVLDCDARASFVVGRGAPFYVDGREFVAPKDAQHHAVPLTCDHPPV